MATQANTPSKPTDSPWVNTLIEGGKWTDGGGVVTITYSFMSGSSGDPFSSGSGGKVWAANEKAAVVAAFECWENVCNIDFVESGNSGTSDLHYWLGSDAQLGNDGTLGWHEMPGGGQTGHLDAAFSYQGTGWTDSGLEQGGYGFVTLIHEIGHGIGLAHPHADYRGEESFPGVSKPFDDFGDFDLNQGIFTTMSYNDGWKDLKSRSYNYGWQATAMALDVAAAQEIYGANTSYNSGNTVYALPDTKSSGTFWACIWDAGGTDSISADGVSVAVTINLNDAELTGANAGGYISHAGRIPGGFTIAANAVIENAVGGSSADTIVGNEVANELSGAAGADTVTGGLGDDTLDGGLGVDVLRGGRGDDVFIVDSANDQVVELSGQGSDTVETGLASYVLGKNVESLVMLSDAGTTAKGNVLANQITCGDGADVLWGRAGADTLTGGAGADEFRFVATTESRPTFDTCDLVTDFVTGEDVIDLGSVITGDFLWNATTAAHSAAAEIWFAQVSVSGDDYTVIHIDTDADTADEMMIRLSGLIALTANDFVL